MVPRWVHFGKVERRPLDATAGEAMAARDALIMGIRSRVLVDCAGDGCLSCGEGDFGSWRSKLVRVRLYLR